MKLSEGEGTGVEKTIVTETQSLWHGYSVCGDFRGQRKGQDGWSSVEELEGGRGEAATVLEPLIWGLDAILKGIKSGESD